MNVDKRPHVARFARCSTWLVFIGIVYLLTSGPILATAFVLREATGWDGFYSVMWLYFPLIALGHGNPIDIYIEWWVVDVFHTVGPG